MKKHFESHLDHGLNEAQIAWLFEHFKDRNAFFIETIELPIELGTVPCGLWGPAMGDPEMVDAGNELPEGEYIIPAGLVAFARAPMRLIGASNGMAARFDIPALDGAITMGTRGARTWLSRLINAPMRPTRKLTVIAGPHEGHECILYTCYGGPQAPQEPTDPKISSAKLEEAIEFWGVHALSRFGS